MINDKSIMLKVLIEHYGYIDIGVITFKINMQNL